jgi:hypothetical protein
MAFKFHIFGVPDGFNLYQGNADDTSYFQRYYDGSKEKTKLAIRRRVNGQVSYSYLKYNIVSAEGRPGAFFGMSVVFEDKEYCKDVKGLYELFDAVYETILQNGILLEDVKGNLGVQAKFLVRSFSNAENEVKKIENIISKNLQNQFKAGKDIAKLDTSFKQGKSDLVRKMNDKNSNLTILTELRTYEEIFISPDYKDTFDNLNDEWKRKKKDNVKKIKDDIIEAYKFNGEIKDDIINKEKNNIIDNKIKDINENIKKLENTINNTLITIKQYIKNQPELEVLQKNYDEVEKQLDELKKAVPNTPSLLPDDFESEEDDTIRIVENGEQKELTIDEALEKMPEYLKNKNYTGVIVVYSGIINSSGATDKQKAKAEELKQQAEELQKPLGKKLVAKIKLPHLPWWGYAVIISGIIGVLLWFLKPDKTDNFPDTDNYVALIQSGDSLLYKVTPPDYDAAIGKFRKAEQLIVAEDNQAASKIEEANKIAIANLEEQAKTAFEKAGGKKIDNYNEAKVILAKAIDYGGNFESIIEQYGLHTIDYYIIEISETRNNNKKKEYANNILTIDGKNKTATDLLAQIDKMDKEAAKAAEAAKKRAEETNQKTLGSTDCIISHKYDSGDTKMKWTTEELLKKADTSLKGNSFDVVISACTAIINKQKQSPACATAEQLKKANNLIITAKSKKDNT